jgi:hypothetical protein
MACSDLRALRNATTAVVSAMMDHSSPPATYANHPSSDNAILDPHLVFSGGQVDGPRAIGQAVDAAEC